METNNLILNPDGTVLIGVSSNANAVIIPDGVKEISNGALYNCTSLKEVTMSDTVTQIGAHAFMGCINLKTVKLSNNVKTIGNCAFRDCSSIENIELPKIVKEIGDLTFYGCTSLKEIDFPQSLSFIGKASFYGCTSLETVKLNANIQNISFKAFNVCSSLKTMYCGIKNIEETIFDPQTFDGYAYHQCKLLTDNIRLCEKHKILGKFERIELDPRANNKAVTNEVVDTVAEISMTA